MKQVTGLIVDAFAGGGGASSGIFRALGRHPDIAINHDAVAIGMHRANHPVTYHYQQDVWSVLPRQATKGNPVSLLWASPDCTHFSRAKGGPPVRDVKRRDLAWVVVRWAEEVRPSVIILENVEEFRTWGPLDAQNKIISSQAGSTFRAWTKRLRKAGYHVEFQCLKACDYGAPTSRRRLFMIARRDGLPIVWPAPTHGDPKSHEVRAGQLPPWRSAAGIIDWSIPCPSIFDRKKPLAENTLKRTAKGIQRYVLDATEPFIMTYYGPKGENDFRGRRLDEPLPTQSTENRFALIAPYLARIGQTGGKGKYSNSLDESVTAITSKAEHLLCIPHLQRQFGASIGSSAHDPVGTITAGGGGKTALVAACMAQHNGGVTGHDLIEPVSTLTQSCTQQQLVTSHLVKFKGTSRDGEPLSAPLHTVQTGQHYGEVRTFLIKYFGQATGSSCADPVHTLTGKDRMGLVTVHIGGEPYVIVDIGMRMLSPRELFRAQGFDDSYQIDLDASGRKITKSDQVRLCGNSVCPPVAEILVRTNLAQTAANLRQMPRQRSIF